MNNIYYKKTYLLFNMPLETAIYMNSYKPKLKHGSCINEYKNTVLESNKNQSILKIENSKKEENKYISNYRSSYMFSNIFTQHLDKYIYIFI
jgi:hypothetical protein